MVSNLFPPYFLGGYEILCSQVCEYFSRFGHEIFVLTSDHGTEAKKTEEDICLPGYKDIARRLKLYLPFNHPPRLLRRKRHQIGRYNRGITQAMIQEAKPDVIFIWSQLRLTLGPARAAQDSRIPVVYTFNDEHPAGYLPAPFAFSPRQIFRYVADHWIYPDITTLGLDFPYSTCISKCLKRNLLAKGFPIDSSRVIYQGIPIERFPCKEEPGSIHGPARVLYVGQLHPYKGVHTLIDACHLVNAHAPQSIMLTIVGDGPEEYKKMLAQKSKEGPTPIDFTGRKPHESLPKIYREHDIFVFPSSWQEPFGLTHLEAMASGTTVISTTEGGHGEFLKNGENALVFPKENGTELARCLEQIIRSPIESERLACQARKMAAQEFSLERYARELEKFLQDIIAQRKK